MASTKEERASGRLRESPGSCSPTGVGVGSLESESAPSATRSCLSRSPPREGVSTRSPGQGGRAAGKHRGESRGPQPAWPPNLSSSAEPPDDCVLAYPPPSRPARRRSAAPRATGSGRTLGGGTWRSGSHSVRQWRRRRREDEQQVRRVSGAWPPPGAPSPNRSPRPPPPGPPAVQTAAPASLPG